MCCYSLEAEHSLDHCPVIYKSKDNPLCLILKENEKDWDFSDLKAVRCKIGTVTIDSEADTDSFDLSEATTGKLKVMIGNQSGIKPQAHDVRVEVELNNGKTIYCGKVRVRVEDPGM